MMGRMKKPLADMQAAVQCGFIGLLYIVEDYPAEIGMKYTQGKRDDGGARN